jgi:molecular chaperone GrpE (heat shock protein)
MFEQIPFIKNLFPHLQDESELKELAFQAETSVRELSDLPPQVLDPAADDVVSILKSTCLLLDRLVQGKQISIVENAEEVAIVADIPVEPEPKQPDETDAEISEPEIEDRSTVATTVTELIIEEPDEPEPTTTAKELIKLRDWVLLAHSSDDETVSPGVLKELYRKLGRILEQEKIVTLEATGEFNYELQEVVDTHATDDPTLDRQIQSTIRPGYLFDEKLIRPQEVIVYTYSEK